MNVDKKIKGNYIYNLIYHFVSLAVPMLVVPYVSRVLKADGVGINSYTNAIATGASLFAALGINSYGQREIAYCGEDDEARSYVFWELVILRFVLTVIVLIPFFCFCMISDQYSYYLILQAPIILAVAFDISWLFRGVENFRIVAYRSIIVKVIAALFVFVLVKNTADLPKYILISSGSILLGNIFFWINIGDIITKVDVSKMSIARHLKGSIEFFIPLIAVQIYSQLDKIMLGSIINSANENGYYEQARKITNLVVTVLVSMNIVLMPRVSSLYAKHDDEKIMSIYKKSFSFLVATTVPMLVLLFWGSDNFVQWFLGNGYDEVSLLLRLSVPIILFMVIGNFVGNQFLIPSGKQNVMSIVYVCAALANLVLNALLIPLSRASGALVASCIAEMMSCFGQVFLLYKSSYRFDMLIVARRFVLPGCVMAAALAAFDKLVYCSGIICSLSQLFVGGLVYLLSLLIADRKFRDYVCSLAKGSRNEKND